MLKLDISAPLDILGTEGQQRIILALVAVLDRHFLDLRPALFSIDRMDKFYRTTYVL